MGGIVPFARLIADDRQREKYIHHNKEVLYGQHGHLFNHFCGNDYSIF